MLETNPFSLLAETVSPFAMQTFIIAMIALITRNNNSNDPPQEFDLFF